MAAGAFEVATCLIVEDMDLDSERNTFFLLGQVMNCSSIAV